MIGLTTPSTPTITMANSTTATCRQYGRNEAATRRTVRASALRCGRSPFPLARISRRAPPPPPPPIAPCIIISCVPASHTRAHRGTPSLAQSILSPRLRPFARSSGQVGSGPRPDPAPCRETRTTTEERRQRRVTEEGRKGRLGEWPPWGEGAGPRGIWRACRRGGVACAAPRTSLLRGDHLSHYTCSTGPEPAGASGGVGGLGGAGCSGRAWPR